MSYEELRALLREKGTCCNEIGQQHPGWICPTVDKLLLHARAKYDREQKAKK